jgi:hypothetical protein
MPKRKAPPVHPKIRYVCWKINKQI